MAKKTMIRTALIAAAVSLGVMYCVNNKVAGVDKVVEKKSWW